MIAEIYMIQFKCSKREYKYKYLVVGYHFSLHICISNKCWWSGQNRKVWTNIATASTRFLLGKFLNKTQLNEPWSVTECYTCEIIKGKIRTVFPANFCFKTGGEWALLLLSCTVCSAVLTRNSINHGSVTVSRYHQRHRTNINIQTPHSACKIL